MAERTATLPEYKHVVFKKSPLELCVAQVRYPPVPGFPEDDLALRLRKAMKKDFPFSALEHTMNLVVTPQGVHQSQGNATWRLTDLSKRWSVVVGEDNVTVETRKYSSFEELVTRTVSAIEMVGQALEISHQTRVGLRYVNEIRHDEGETYKTWTKLLAPDLLGVSRANLLGGEVEQTIAEARARRSDGSLLIRHGFLKGTTIAAPNQAPPKQSSFYLLDLDYFNEETEEYGAGLKERLIAYHSVIYRIFRWAIGEGDLYRSLGATE